MSKTEFIRKLAEYLVEDQAGKSILLQAGNKGAKAWAALRGATPLHGYLTVEEAVATLTEFLSGSN
jgi:hypothetical protein